VLYLYTILFYLVLPVVFVRLWWRGRKVAGYRERVKERLGYYDFELERCIWVHAVSMGESIAAIPLIKSLAAQYPNIPLLVTSMTPTGAERIKASFGNTVKQAYLPYDLPSAMKRFLKTMRPEIAIIMETEIWPNLIDQCARQQIPICLVNARLSEKSARGYARIPSIIRTSLAQLSLIAAHGEPDANRFIALGALPEHTYVTGNIKFDLELSQDLMAKTEALRTQLGTDRFIWIAASTHEGEEEIILNVHAAIRKVDPQALLILVPRHPDRFAAIAKLCEQQFITKRRSLNEACDKQTAVYLGDTMGEMMLLYGAADVAFVGGSLIPRGGHNLLEPGALRKPILIGQYLFNFKEISEKFFASQGAIKVMDEEGFKKELTALMSNRAKREEVGNNAFQVVESNRGALAKQMQLIKSFILDKS